MCWCTLIILPLGKQILWIQDQSGIHSKIQPGLRSKTWAKKKKIIGLERKLSDIEHVLLFQRKGSEFDSQCLPQWFTIAMTPAPGCSDTSVFSGYFYSYAPIFNNVILLNIIKTKKCPCIL